VGISVQVESAEEIVQGLRDQGYFLSQSVVYSTGRFAPTDVEWNYKDIPHINHVHSQVGGITFYTDHDASSSLFIQNILGIRAIFCGILYKSSPTSMTYLFSLGVFIIIVETDWQSISESHTKVRTTYHIGSARLFRLLHGVVHGMLKRNYRLLMKEDMPMRLRRGDLRARGYTYRADSEGVSFLQSLRTGQTNLVRPVQPEGHTLVDVDLAAFNDGTSLVGSDDFGGMRISKAGTQVQLFPRICRHDGASLDGQSIGLNQAIKCPWHGNECGAILSLDLSDSATQCVDWGPNIVTVNSTQLTITSRVDEP
jgi:hypothetical protein